MRVIYNGIDMCVLETHLFDCESVYDDSGTDYLYTKVSIAVRALINGQVEQVEGKAPGPFMSYNYGPITSAEGRSPPAVPVPRLNPIAQVGPIPPAQVGIDTPGPTTPLRPVFRAVNAPLLTHQVIRHRLGTPRGTLWIFSGPGSEGGALPGTKKGVPTTLTPNGAIGGGVTSSVPNLNGDTAFEAAITLRCPAEGLSCDCKNGPKPKLLSVISAMGEYSPTLMVDWMCEAYINEGPMNSTNPSGALLSNRFSQHHSVNEEGFLYLTTVGEALFRTDLVYRLLLNPDATRAILFMPILQGFVRKDIQVRGLPDVTGVEYSYTDKQQHMNFPAGPYAGAASITAFHKQSVVCNTDLLGSGINLYERALSLKANRYFASQGDAPGGGPVPPSFRRDLLGKVPK